MMSLIAQWIGVVLVIFGTLFTVVAAYGVMYFNNTFQRQHAAAKPQMAGFLCFAFGVALIVQSWTWTGVLLLAVMLQTMTAPVGAHLLAYTTARIVDSDDEDEN